MKKDGIGHLRRHRNNSNMRDVFLGTSGLVLPVPNKSFYPAAFKEKSRLTYYSSLFNTIEINSSFYKLPRKSTIANWAGSVPDNFAFTFKLWKEITHRPALEFDPRNIGQFMEAISAAGTKKGCLLVQFPGKIGIDDYNQIEKILYFINESDITKEWKVHVELRNTSLYVSEIYELLKEYNAGMVIHDIAKSTTLLDAFEGESMYLRFHGPEPGYTGSYSEKFLQNYARLIRDWHRKGKPVYGYFNNTLGSAFDNLTKLKQLIAM
ncbi:MAG TPA: DUF72 domain-containing protein [Flavitalea sp.]|nr:DUF72 domain-containing protein [Flavitalea sp.]